MNSLKIKLIKCPECKGEGWKECCDGHMCPGTTKCWKCNGTGKGLPKRYDELLNYLLTLTKRK